jgi:periplasmic divalent cation tolerance protein
VSNPVVVLSTVARPEDAERIAQALVERRLAACVNVVPGVLSLYRWEGRVEREVERLLVIKTTRERFQELRLALLQLHPYQVPELLVLPVVGGHVPYMEWVIESTAAPRADGGPLPPES